jgi:group I intron endonuclease
MHSIYIVTNLITAKQYVGLTKNLKVRWGQHRRMNGTAKYLHASIKTHGIENFVFTHIADAFDLESAQIIERLLIAERNTKIPHGYNLTDGGEGIIGFVFSEESKQKMRDSAKGQTRSAESNMKRAMSLKNNKNSLGKLRSPETKAKMKIAQTGRKHTEEAKAKMKAAKAIQKAKKMKELA